MIRNQEPANETITEIARRSSYRIIDLSELSRYKDLFRYLIWRQIKTRYAQSAIGIGWAIIQPLFTMLVFTIVFGNLAKIDSEGVPYAIFSLVAIVPWTYLSNAVTEGSQSLVTEASMIRKVYFPRILLPASTVAAKLVDLGISLGLLVILLIYYRQMPSSEFWMLPALALVMVIFALGLNCWLSALAIQFRDVKHAVGFIVQIGMYATPVVYSANTIPEKYLYLYAVNPMVGVIEGGRSVLLNTQPFAWDLFTTGLLSSLFILSTGLIFFHSRESVFADVS